MVETRQDRCGVQSVGKSAPPISVEVASHQPVRQLIDAGASPLSARGPLHLEATVRLLQRRPANRVDIWEQGRYLRAFTTAQGPALIEVANRGTIAEPDVGYAILAGRLSATSAEHVGRTLRKVLGLNVDPVSFERLAECEPQLRSTGIALRGMRPPRYPSLFEAFANVVPFQQLSLEAGVAIVGKLAERFGEPLDHDGRRFRLFPTAQRIANAKCTALRACGLSAQKAKALRHVGRVINSGELNEDRIARMNTRHALQTLLELPGIGPWSAALVLLRGFGRLDVFPPGDVGAARGLRTLLNIELRAPLDPIIERFGNLRGYLYFYALGADLLRKGFIHAASSPGPDSTGT